MNSSEDKSTLPLKHRHHLSPTETKSLLEYLVAGKKETGSEHRLPNGLANQAATHFHVASRTIYRIWKKACNNHRMCGEYIIHSNQMTRKYDRETIRQVVSQIEKPFTMPVQLLAEKTGISQQTLQQYGDLIYSIELEQNLRHLLHPDMGIGAAAACAGLGQGQPSCLQPRIRGGSGGDNDSSADTAASSAASFTSPSKWPEALPPTMTTFTAGEEGDENVDSSSCPYFLSAVCDATHIHWALHEPMAETVFHPSTFWKTSVPVEQQQETAAPSAFEFFSTYFPEKAIRAILAGNRPDIIHTATATAATTIHNNTGNNNSSKAALLVQKLLPYWPVAQRIPVLFVYVIATNDATFGFLQHLTSRLPVRLIPLQTVDFFDTIPPSSHATAATGDGGGGARKTMMTMSVDRLAALAAAQCIYGGPALVIHAGDANLQYAATDMQENDDDASTPRTSANATMTTKESSSSTSSSSSDHHQDALCHSIRVRCGCIGPGLAAQFFILQSTEGSGLSSVNFEEFQQYLAKLKKEQEQQKQNGGETATATAAAPPRIMDAHSTKEEIMRHVVHETTSRLRSLIATWTKQALASPTFQRQQKDTNYKAARGSLLRKAVCNRLFYVCISGGREGQILQDLLSLSSAAADDENDTSFLHPDTAWPELPCTVNFVYQEFLAHHGISHLLSMQHERREQQRHVASHPFAPTAAITANSSSSKEDDYNLRTMAVGQRVAVKKLLDRLAIVRGTVVSVQKRHVSSSSNSNGDDDDDDDGNVYHIKYDDGQKDEMNGEELHDALVLYHAQGEKTQRRLAVQVNESLEKMRGAKRAAAKDVAKLLEQCVSVVVKKLEAERQAVTAAPTKASASTICSEDKRADKSVEATGEGLSSESSKTAPAMTATDDRAATKEAAATADETIHPQAAKEKDRFDADKPGVTEVQAKESSKNVVVAASSTSDTAVPKPNAATKESAVPDATNKPQTAATMATRPRKTTEASIAPTSVAAKKKATPASSKTRQAASVAAAPAKTPKKAQAATAAAKTPKSASEGKAATADAAATKPKSVSTAQTSKRPRASPTPAPESVKKPRKTSPRQRPSPPAAAGPPLAAPPTAVLAGPILPPTKKSLKESPKSYEKQRVAKYFPPNGLFFGQVNYYNSDDNLWRIIYDDNDREDYDASDMIQHGELYELHKHEDPKRRH